MTYIFIKYIVICFIKIKEKKNTGRKTRSVLLNKCLYAELFHSIEIISFMNRTIKIASFMYFINFIHIYNKNLNTLNQLKKNYLSLISIYLYKYKS